jgi:D-arabinose 1-dehydrogenase-like Zn-dependent alcohol dehydrogenase/tetratricopeptide (TPR) repeat protein
LASVNVDRAKQSLTGKDYDATLRNVERALTSHPGDPDVRFAAGESWLALGRPATARKEYTIALTGRTDFTTAYLGRAMAAARLGDARRARADLDSASRLDSAAAGKARAAIEAELDKQKVSGSAEKLLADLEQGARSNLPVEQLIDVATKVHKITGDQRLRYDEIYQDRLRGLEETVRTNPKNPDKLADWASYLIEESDNRGEKVEPRREVVQYRWQESPEKELGRAIQIADRALALNPRHVGAIMQKALALTGLKQYDQAERLADQALSIAGNNPDALRLYARFRATRANQMSNEAGSLRQERCTSSSHDETRSDGVYRVTTTACYPPTQGDLQRAAQLDAQAADLRRKARAAMEAAVRVTKGTVEGYLIQADLDLWDGKRGKFICCQNLRITGFHDDGGYAQYMIARSDVVALIPDSLSPVEAAPILCAGITTFNSLRHSGAVAGDLVVVQGLGGLGHLGIQFANKMGYRTVAIGRGKDKEALARKLGAAEYLDADAGKVAEKLAALGGASVILATAPNSKAMSELIDGLGVDGKLLIVGASPDPVNVTPIQLSGQRRSIQGWPSGSGRDSEETLSFCALTGVRPMVETFPLEQAQTAYDRMLSGKARFRVVLTMN